MRTSFRVGKFRQDMNFLRLGRSWVIGYGRGDGSPLDDRHGSSVLDKFCYTDERILSKILGVENAALPSEARWRGYDIVKKHGREVPISKALQARHALGMDGLDVLLPCLQPIPL